MEKIIKEHIAQNLEDTKVHFKYSGVYYISDNFIDGVADTFSVSNDLIKYYLDQMLINYKIDKNSYVMRAFYEFPEIFGRNHTILDVIADIKKIKTDFVAEQNYHMASYYRDYEKGIEISATKKWNKALEHMNETTD